MFSSNVSINLSGLKRFQAVFTEDLKGTSNGPVRKALKQWGARYRSFAQERFDSFSKGQGDWPPLSDATLARRRKGSRKSSSNISVTGKQIRNRKDGSIDKRFKRKKETAAAPKAAILRDTGTLFGALAPVFQRKPGSIEEDIPFGIRVGYGGPMRHPKSAKGPTIANIAAFHQAGGGRLPQRRIIVLPPAHVVAAMAGDMQRAIDSMDK